MKILLRHLDQTNFNAVFNSELNSYQYSQADFSRHIVLYLRFESAQILRQGNVHVSSFGFGRTDLFLRFPLALLQFAARQVAQMPMPSSGERTFTMPLDIQPQGWVQCAMQSISRKLPITISRWSFPLGGSASKHEAPSNAELYQKRIWTAGRVVLLLC